MRNTVIFSILIIVFLSDCYAQKIDHLQSYAAINSDSYLRFSYDNDFFTASDENYTQGYSFELVAPFLDANPVNYLFYKPKEVVIRYGISVEHIGFTPNKYELPEIQLGDRPFAAAIYVKSFMIATDFSTASRFTSSVSAGVIGPAAFGDAMQTEIHKITGNKLPLGWHNQIKNDLVLNYEMGYEKQLFRHNDLFSVQAQANAKIGTLFTNAKLGFNTTFGIINSPFSNNDTGGFKWYAYAQPVLNVIGYDATLQGGLFNDSSPYTIASRDVERFTGQLNFGLVLQTGSLYLEYSRALITREFESGSAARWGGFKVGYRL